LEFCIAEFKKKTGKDITKNTTAVGILRTKCEDAKRILSSAHQASIECETLSNGEDFKTTISRAKFEELCMDLFQECESMLKMLFKDSEIDKGKSKKLCWEVDQLKSPRFRR
jgi:L1 cell adhesion molecule like protein